MNDITGEKYFDNFPSFLLVGPFIDPIGGKRMGQKRGMEESVNLARYFIIEHKNLV